RSRSLRLLQRLIERPGRVVDGLGAGTIVLRCPQEFFGVLTDDVPPQVEVVTAIPQRHIRWLELPGRDHVVHATGSRHRGGVPPVQEEGWLGRKATEPKCQCRDRRDDRTAL